MLAYKVRITDANDDTKLIIGVYVEQPAKLNTFGYNSPVLGYSGRGGNWADIVASAINHSGYVANKSVFYARSAWGEPRYTYLQQMGFPIQSADVFFQLGTRFWLSKFHSIRITNVTTSNNTRIYTFGYFYEGTQVFSVTANDYGYFAFSLFPWLYPLAQTALGDTNKLHMVAGQANYYTSADHTQEGNIILVACNGTVTRQTWDTWVEGIEPIDTKDPYVNIDDSEPSGPAEGVGIPSSDPVDFPGLPSFSATDTGFITLFNPTLGQVKALADYMWNGLFDVNNLRKIFADPMDCILGFNMLPVAIPNLGPADVCIGNLVSSVSMNVASSQWVEVNCGQLDLGLPYGSYLDFSPYTKYAIYLPYIGTCDLSADDVAGKVLQLKYHVDILSCSCVAYLKCGDSILYQWTGSCGYSIPVTQNDFSRMIMTIIGIAGAAIGGAVTGGAGAAIARAGESAAKNVMGLKPEVHRSGAIGSSAGLMGGQTPYLILEVPKACKPAKQYHYLGYPSFTTVRLGDVSGRQDFESVILDGIPCTEEEREMIAAACEGGIYL